MRVHGYAARAPKGELEPFEYDLPPLGPLEADVRVRYCGVCHSDLEMLDNNWGMTAFPLVPGHEVVGEVVAVGAAVRDLRAGQTVGVGWTSASCLDCRSCRRGREHLCVRPEAVGQTVVGRHGGFADLVRCQARWAVPVPAGLDPATAGPLMCAGTTVWTPITHYGVAAGMRTAVVGVGGLGHLAVQFLAKFGTEVTAVSTTRSKEAEARRLGAAGFIATRGTDELERAAGAFDFVLSTVSADVEWDRLLAALAPSGTLCVCGVPASDLQVPAFPLIAGEKRVVGGRAGAPGDTADMMAFCAAHGVAAVCEQFPLRDVNRAVRHVREGKARYRVVLAA